MDLNCDVGESFGPWRIGDDPQLIPLVTSVNIACGWHAGDPQVMQATVALAHGHGVAVGAHPGLPDLQGFGRREMSLAPAEVEAAVLYQIGALAGFARATGAELRHVKAHGALYNTAARDGAIAAAIVRAARTWSHEMIVVGLSSSALTAAAEAIGQPVAYEAFIDRRYEADGTLRSRRYPDALLDLPTAVEQAVGLARDGVVQTVDGTTLQMRADSLCIHGDTPGAVQLAIAVREAFKATGIPIQQLQHTSGR